MSDDQSQLPNLGSNDREGLARAPPSVAHGRSRASDLQTFRLRQAAADPMEMAPQPVEKIESGDGNGAPVET